MKTAIMKTVTYLPVISMSRGVWRLLFVVLVSAMGVSCDLEGDKFGGAGDELSETQEAATVSYVAPITRTAIDGTLLATCQDHGYDIGFNVNSNIAGTQDYYFYQKAGEFVHDLWKGNNDYIFSVTVSSAGPYLSWGGPKLYTSNGVIPIGVAAVIVKGGPYAYIYKYTPNRRLGDAELIPPIGPGSEKSEISHFSFCMNLNLLIDNTVDGTIGRTYDWHITKAVTNTDDAQVALADGAVFDIDYAVTLSWTTEDKLMAVDGTVIVENPWPVDAVVTSIEDVVKGVGSMPLICMLGGEYVLATGGEPVIFRRGDGPIACTFEQQFAIDDKRNVLTSEYITNTARVVTAADSIIDGASATVTTRNVEVVGYNDCFTVTDSLKGELFAEAELPDENVFGSATRTYTHRLEPGKCREKDNTYDVVNIATVTACDSNVIASAEATVAVTVPACENGCTLTQGYWKTHSKYGPAPYNDNWAQVPDCETGTTSDLGSDTPFLNINADRCEESGEGSGTNCFMNNVVTWYDILWTPPKGNAYLILAHQYIAAMLNKLNGADTTDIDNALTDAEDLLSTKAAGDFCVKTSHSADKDDAIELAAQLADFNEGNSGPGYCDE